MEAKLTYIRMNSQTPWPPRRAVPVTMQKIIGLLLIFGLTFFGNRGLADVMVLQPTDLKRPCTLEDVIQFVDDQGSGHLTLVDAKGNHLEFIYADSTVYFESQGTKTKSQKGSSEEQCLLKVIKESFAKINDPTLQQEPGAVAGRKRFFEQKAIKHFILVLEDRCASK